MTEEEISEQMDTQLSHEEAEELNQVREFIPETQIEFDKFLVDPDAKQLFKEINKDLVLGNFNEKEMFIIRSHFELMGHLIHLEMDDSAMAILRDALVYANTSRSKGGFERRMLTTHTMKSQRTFEQKNKKGWFK